MARIVRINQTFDDEEASSNHSQEIPISFEFSVPVIVYISVAIQILLLSAIFIGNLWVITLMVRFRRLRNTSNLFTASMAFADFLLSLALIPGVKVTFDPAFVSDINLCLLLWLSQVFASTMSVLSLLCLSLDRLLKIVKPLRYQALMTESKAGMVIIAIWLYGLCSVILPPFAGLRNDGVLCFDFARVFNFYHIHFMFIFNGFFPFALLLCIYAYMFKIVREKNRTSEFSMNDGKLHVWRRELKTLLTLSIIVGFTGCAWLPSTILVLLDLHFPTVQASLTIRTIFSWFTYLNSVVNPVLYALRSEQFKETSREMISRDVSSLITILRNKSRRNKIYPSSMTGTSLS